MIEFHASKNQQTIDAALLLPDDTIPSIANQKEVETSRTRVMTQGIVISILSILLGLFFLYLGLIDLFGPPGTGVGIPFWLPLLGGVFAIAGGITHSFVSIRSKVAKLDQSTAEKASNDYYCSLLDVTGAYGWGRAYSLLAQTNFTLPGGISFEEFPVKWVEAVEKIAGYFFQGTIQRAQCNTCGKKASGVWSEKPTGFIMKGTKLVKCENNECNETYCFKCYSKLGFVRKCKCGKVSKWHKLLEIDNCGYDAVQFCPNPTIKVEKLNERISNVTLDFQGKTTIKRADGSGQISIDFQCRFRNSTVNIGGKWYLTQSGPGEIASWG